MAGLEDADHVCHLEPLVVTAHLQQGLVIDQFYGLSLDGLLVSQTRRAWAHYLGLERDSGADLDGGLSIENPVDWSLPLAVCVPEDEPNSWHWLCSTASALGPEGELIPDITPGTHRLSVRMDARRAHQVAVRVPATAGGASGRFRPRITPVLNLPARAVRWTAVGCQEDIRNLLDSLTSVGGRRGTGEGVVMRWEVLAIDEKVSAWHFGHKGISGAENQRPIPASCGRLLGMEDAQTCIAGIRPPVLHHSRQRRLVMPTSALTSS